MMAAAACTTLLGPLAALLWNPIPGLWRVWYLMLLPLCLGVSIVYKSIKCHEMKQVPREAAVIFAMIIGGIVGAALVLWIMVRVVTG